MPKTIKGTDFALFYNGKEELDSRQGRHNFFDGWNTMTVSTLSDSVYTDFQGLSQLKYKAATDTPKALQEVGKHFEALFIQMMLKSMREATPDNPLFGDKAEELYRGLFDKQISMNIASNSKLGLADMIVRQLQHNVGTQNTTQNDAIKDESSMGTSSLTGSPGNDKSSDTQAALSPTKFVKDLWPYAKTAAKQLNVDPQVLVAQRVGDEALQNIPMGGAPIIYSE